MSVPVCAIVRYLKVERHFSTNVAIHETSSSQPHVKPIFRDRRPLEKDNSRDATGFSPFDVRNSWDPESGGKDNDLTMIGSPSKLSLPRYMRIL